jgi:hypothetical protein
MQANNLKTCILEAIRSKFVSTYVHFRYSCGWTFFLVGYLVGGIVAIKIILWSD